MPTTEKLRKKLQDKIKELFQLDQPELDFGFYRIMHAKNKQILEFIDNDLLKIIEDAFGQVDEDRKINLKTAYEKELETAKSYGVRNPEESKPVKKTKEALKNLQNSISAEGDVYDHLYLFFERYYDDGDFISRRYYTRENSNKVAPFAIPYNGEEVKLHWANADQYYIKTTEYFTNYTFDITQAVEIRKMSEEQKKLNFVPDIPIKINFRAIDASESEHDNVKENDNMKVFLFYMKIGLLSLMRIKS